MAENILKLRIWHLVKSVWMLLASLISQSSGLERAEYNLPKSIIESLYQETTNPLHLSQKSTTKTKLTMRKQENFGFDIMVIISTYNSCTLYQFNGMKASINSFFQYKLKAEQITP